MNAKIKTVIGFDFGKRWIGVAAGQTVTRSANPITTLQTKNGLPNWNALNKIIKEWQPDALVVGSPLNMDGSNQWITEHATAFAEALKKAYNLPVFMIDERLTTIAAKDILFEEKGYRGLTKQAIDSKAAALILESWLHHYTEKNHD